MFEYNTLSLFFSLIMLGIIGYFDYKTRKVPLFLNIIFFFGSFLIVFLFGKLTFEVLITALFAIILFKLIEYGVLPFQGADFLAIINLTILFGIKETLFILLLSVIMIIVILTSYKIFLEYEMNKIDTLPFMPFLAFTIFAKVLYSYFSLFL